MFLSTKLLASRTIKNYLISIIINKGKTIISCNDHCDRLSFDVDGWHGFLNGLLTIVRPKLWVLRYVFESAGGLPYCRSLSILCRTAGAVLLIVRLSSDWFELEFNAVLDWLFEMEFSLFAWIFCPNFSAHSSMNVLKSIWSNCSRRQFNAYIRSLDLGFSENVVISETNACGRPFRFSRLCDLQSNWLITMIFRSFTRSSYA